jgi:CHAD domain-containing protein
MSVRLDDSLRLLAAQYIRKQLRQLTGQIDGIRRAEDLECVHRARVASRRLRSALRMFRDCLPAKKLKTWCKEVRRVTEDLGEARDKDVQIAFVCGVLAGLQETSLVLGVSHLLVHLEDQRDALQPKVVKALDRLLDSRVLDQMMRMTKRMSSGLEAQGVRVASPLVLQLAGRKILPQIEDLRALEHSLADPQDFERHHALRISLKRLRYTLEICKPAYSGLLDGLVETVKQVQTLLGEIHDCDVWVEFLQAYVEEERKRIAKLYGHPGPLEKLRVGLDDLRQNRQAQREELFQKLVADWRQLTGRGFWDALVELVRSRPEPAPASTVAGDSAGQPQPQEAARPDQEAPNPVPDRSDGKPQPDGESPLDPAEEPAAPELQATEQQEVG